MTLSIVPILLAHPPPQMMLCLNLHLLHQILNLIKIFHNHYHLVSSILPDARWCARALPAQMRDQLSATKKVTVIQLSISCAAKDERGILSDDHHVL